MADDTMDVDEEDFFQPLKKLIEGCENYVTEKVSEMKTDLKREVQVFTDRLNEKEQDKEIAKKENEDTRKRVQALEMKDKEDEHLSKRIKVLEDERDGLKKRVIDLEQKLISTENHMKRLNDLEEKMKVKEAEVAHIVQTADTCKCKELFDGFVNIGNAVFSGGQIMISQTPQDKTLTQTSVEQSNLFVSDPVISASALHQPTPIALDHDSSATPSCSTIIDQYTPPGVFYSTPDRSDFTQEETVHTSPDVSYSATSPLFSKPLVSSCSTDIGRKRKGPYTVQSKKLRASSVYETMDDLPEDMKHLLQKYHSPRSAMATKEKLTDLQRTYVDYFMNSHQNYGPTEMATLCVSKGIEDKIWTSTFNPRPGSGSTFHEYLTQRIKNKLMRKNSLKLKGMVNTQAERLCGTSTKRTVE